MKLSNENTLMDSTYITVWVTDGSNFAIVNTKASQDTLRSMDAHDCRIITLLGMHGNDIRIKTSYIAAWCLNTPESRNMHREFDYAMSQEDSEWRKANILFEP